MDIDLKIFLNPLPDELFEAAFSSSSFLKNIKVYHEKMPDLKGMDVAMIGLEEERGTVANKGVASGALEIRKKLYELKKGTGRYRIADLGNIRNGVSHEETISRIRVVGQALLEDNILPIFFGGSHDLTFGQFLAYEELEKLVSLLNVDAFLDLEEGASRPECQKFLHSILLHEPNYLFNYSHLAYQSYLIDNKLLETLERLYFEAYRIGEIRTNIAEMEPVIRNADLLSFDITAIRSSDAPGNAGAQPFGLTGEEACQIAWYAGTNEKLTSAGFYDYNPSLDDPSKKTASVVATIIWYFIEGFYHRRKELNFKTNDYLKYVVSMQSEPATLTFYKSTASEKWWMEVPYPAGKDPYSRSCIVPCSYSDYQTATKGEVPERYVATHAKLL